MSHDIKSLQKFPYLNYFTKSDSNMISRGYRIFKFDMSVDKQAVTHCIFEICTLVMKEVLSATGIWLINYLEHLMTCFNIVDRISR